MLDKKIYKLNLKIDNYRNRKVYMHIKKNSKTDLIKKRLR